MGGHLMGVHLIGVGIYFIRVHLPGVHLMGVYFMDARFFDFPNPKTFSVKVRLHHRNSRYLPRDFGEDDKVMPTHLLIVDGRGLFHHYCWYYPNSRT
jgi:hypothetical protein